MGAIHLTSIRTETAQLETIEALQKSTSVREEFCPEAKYPGEKDYNKLRMAAETSRFCLYAFTAIRKEADENQKNYGFAELRCDFIREMKRMKAEVDDTSKWIPAPLFKKVMAVIRKSKE